MKKCSILIFISCILLLSNLSINADCLPCCPGSWYIAGSGSASWHHQQRFIFGMQEEEHFFSRKYKQNWGGNFSIGYLIPARDRLDFRVEGEFVYRTHNLTKGRYMVFAKKREILSKTLSLRGHSKDSAVMANLIADFCFCPCWKFYFGLGVGASFNRSTLKFADHFRVKPPFSRNSWLVATQLISGFSYQWTNCMVLTLGYRLFSTSEVLAARTLLRSDNRPYIQSVDLGIRFQL